MKKILIVFLIIVMALSFSLTGCSSSKSETPKDDGKVYTIKVAYVVAESHASHIVMRDVFKKELEATGKFKVELYPNGQLGADRQAIESVGLGSVEMTMAGEAAISGFIPEFELVGLPYLFTSIDSARNALDGEFGKELDKLLEEQDIVNLGWGEVGFRNITNDNKEIISPADLTGIKIRTMENPLHIAFFKALGANPTPMAFTELFTALQQGTVDAQENPTALTYNSKFYEVQKFMTVSEHVYTAAPILVNKTFFESLPEDLRATLVEVSTKTRDAQRELILEQNTDFEAKMQEEGVTVTVLTPEQKEAFKAIAEEAVYPIAIENYGDTLIKLAQKYNK